jgi:cytochrome c oxidase subunit 1
MTQAELQEQANKPAHAPGHGATKWQDYFTFNTDHKVIGIQYLVAAFFFFFVGGILATIIRVELATPASDFVSPENYNRIFTMHGTIMIFLWVVPAGTGAFATI